MHYQRNYQRHNRTIFEAFLEKQHPAYANKHIYIYVWIGNGNRVR